MLRVADFQREEQVTVAEDLALPALLDAFVRSRRNHLYVVGRRRGVQGCREPARGERGAARRRPTPSARSPRDILRPRFETTTPDESLPRVLERFAAQDSERLPVLAADGSRRLVGTISKRDVLAAYARELMQKRTDNGGQAL